MYDMEYLIYKVHPYGMIQHIEPLPEKVPYNPNLESTEETQTESENSDLENI